MSLGNKILITLIDTRFNEVDKLVISLIEGDLNTPTLQAYCAPVLTLTIQEIDKIQIGMHKILHKKY